MKQRSIAVLLLLITGYLGSFQNKICIYNRLDPDPVKILPYSVSIFPQNDQDMLSEGIPYRNEAEFHKLMEDFLS